MYLWQRHLWSNFNTNITSEFNKYFFCSFSVNIFGGRKLSKENIIRQINAYSILSCLSLSNNAGKWFKEAVPPSIKGRVNIGAWEKFRENKYCFSGFHKSWISHWLIKTIILMNLYLYLFTLLMLTVSWHTPRARAPPLSWPRSCRSSPPSPRCRPRPPAAAAPGPRPLLRPPWTVQRH